MNDRTAKLLSRYAARTGTSEKELKRNWKRLNRVEREAERKRLERELGD